MEDHNKQLKGALVALPYFHAFGRPLIAKEVRRYGWGKELDLLDVRKRAYLWRQNIDGTDWYSLSPVNPVQIQKNAARLDEYWQWAGKKAWVLTYVPFVELIMVMNGLAWAVLNEHSDIDLFVVAKVGRVWTVRGWMLFWLRMLGLRATAKQQAKKFSPEFFVDAEHQMIPLNHSISPHLTSFWVADFTPLVYPQKFPEFWQANRWLSEYLPVAYKSPHLFEGAVRSKPWITKVVEGLLGGWLGDIIEKQAMRWQQKIIERNLLERGREVGTVINESEVRILWPLNTQRAQNVARQIEEFLG